MPTQAEGDKKRNRNLIIGATVLNIVLFIIIFFVTDKEWNKGTAVGDTVGVLGLIASTLSVWFGVMNKWNWLTPNLTRAFWIGGIIVGFAAPRLF